MDLGDHLNSTSWEIDHTTLSTWRLKTSFFYSFELWESVIKPYKITPSIFSHFLHIYTYPLVFILFPCMVNIIIPSASLCSPSSLGFPIWFFHVNLNVLSLIVSVILIIVNSCYILVITFDLKYYYEIIKSTESFESIRINPSFANI